MATNRINARQNWQLGFFYAPVKIFFGFSQTRSALHAMGTCRTPCYMLHGLEGLIRTYTNQTLQLYCTLPRRGINWEILPPRTKRFPKSRDFATRGPRDCPRAISRGCLIWTSYPNLSVTILQIRRICMKRALGPFGFGTDSQMFPICCLTTSLFTAVKPLEYQV